MLVKNIQRENFKTWNDIKLFSQWYKTLFAFTVLTILYAHFICELTKYTSLEKFALPLCDMIQKSDCKHSLFWYLVLAAHGAKITQEGTVACHYPIVTHVFGLIHQLWKDSVEGF